MLFLFNNNIILDAKVNDTYASTDIVVFAVVKLYDSDDNDDAVVVSNISKQKAKNHFSDRVNPLKIDLNYCETSYLPN